MNSHLKVMNKESTFDITSQADFLKVRAIIPYERNTTIVVQRIVMVKRLQYFIT